ncbi:MAG TPA: enoyl-CoA hydratase-related protein [Syntrophales bacterium]|nr:enoyl-CoA hydratase-related protein [Syntrophales bacterium]
MEFEHILLEKWDSVSVLRMNRPQSLNALSTGHLTDIVKGLEICAEDDAVRCVVLTGQGRAFCSGGDIGEFRDSLDTNPSEPLRQIIKLLNIAILAIRTMHKPVLAAINGAAGGAGISLAAACDLRLCAASARFRQAYTSLGLVPDGAWALLVPLLIGFSRANELIFLDTVFDARQALEWGLVNRVVEDPELEREVHELSGRLARGATTAFAIAKENMNHSMMDLLERQLERERSGMIRAGKTRDYQEGARAFFAKRLPEFSGK